jgi:hypothetical protein
VSVRLPTWNGFIELDECRGPAKCISPGCAVRGGGHALIKVDRGDERLASFTMCGNCLALGLAHGLLAPVDVDDARDA